MKILRKKNYKEHTHNPSKIEFFIALLIVIVLTISLVSQQFVEIPRYLTVFFILIFLGLKIHHIWIEGGTFLEDYTTITAITLFLILYLILKEDINIALTTIFIFILIYSTGLMLWIKIKFESRKIVHFLISYITIIIMVVLLFAGAYTSGNGSFIEQGKEKQLSFSEAIYLSVITFTTVGYGDITPIGINRLFASLEAIMGVIINVALIGYLLSSGRYNYE